jgi:Periplasmic binding protein
MGRGACCRLRGGCAAGNPAPAQLEGKTVRIGVLTDLSSVFSDGGGLGSVDAARMAIEDFGGKVAGAKIELIEADHLNKADVGSAIAREWFDQRGVDMIVDLQNSAIALAVSEIARTKQGRDRHRRGRTRADRRQLLPEHDPLGVGHLRQRQRARTAVGEEGVRQVVLYRG